MVYDLMVVHLLEQVKVMSQNDLMIVLSYLMKVVMLTVLCQIVTLMQPLCLQKLPHL